MSVQEVIQQVRQLPRHEQHELMQWLEKFLRDDNASDKPYSVWDFEGIAAHLADDEDPQAYIKHLCDEWDSER